MSHLERRVLVRSIAIGLIVTSAVLGAGAIGLLDTLEYWLYDQRAIYCQLSEPQPTTRLIHLDIDDASVDAVGKRWPWPRATLARILDEIQRARPTALGLDILLSDPQEPRLVQDSQGGLHTIDDDAELTRVLKQSGKAVLAASFNVESSEAQSPLFLNAVSWFTDDLELTQDAFDKKVAASGSMNLSDLAMDHLFFGAQRQAMKERIDRELDKGAATPEALLPRLLPHTDPTVNSPLTNLLRAQYTISSAAHAIYRFGAPNQTLALPPVHGTLSVLPMRVFSDVAGGCAFANYDIFDTSTVRSVPLFVEFNHRLFPQMGLATACVMLGADPSQARFDGSTILIPAPGGTISIPTYIFHSKTLGRDVPLIAAVPWFGKRDWETMYDWPSHKTSAAHISIAKIWDDCTTLDKIAKNSASIDEAISQVLDNDREDKLSIDPDLAKKYAAHLPEPQDIEVREKMAELTLKNLKDSGWLDAYRQMSDNQMTPVEKFQRDKLYDANNALLKLTSENRKLHDQIETQRKWLAAQIGGKGVLVGFVATGLQDQVSTSLHLRAPGVVVHGVIANAVLTGRWWHIAPDWITLLLTFILGSITSAALGWFTPVRASLVSMALLVGYLLINGLVLFGWRRWIVGVAGPATAIVMVWAACTLYRLILEGIERNRIATEVAVINREMELAKQVQVALIPTAAPKVQSLEADGWAQTASVTGGDCYDLWELPDGRLAVLLADASGHGLAPAMVVSQVRTLVRALCEFESHPHGLLTRVNSRIANDLESSRFITVFLGFISPDGKLDWASAGHGPTYWRSEEKGELLELDSTGMPLGIMDPWVADGSPAPLQLGDTGTLIVFSDGIFEAPAPSRNGEQFGVDRVKEILSRTCDQSCAQIISALKLAVQQWQGKIEPIDDQTIVVVRKTCKNA